MVGDKLKTSSTPPIGARAKLKAAAYSVVLLGQLAAEATGITGGGQSSSKVLSSVTNSDSTNNAIMGMGEGGEEESVEDSTAETARNESLVYSFNTYKDYNLLRYIEVILQ